MTKYLITNGEKPTKKNLLVFMTVKIVIGTHWNKIRCNSFDNTSICQRFFTCVNVSDIMAYIMVYMCAVPTVSSKPAA